MATTTIDITRALATPDLRWPFEDELRWLAERAATHKRIVEVGSYLGRSTCALAANTPGQVFALDDWYGPRDDAAVRDEDRPHFYARFLDNVKGLPVTPIRCDHAETTELRAEWLRGPDDQKPDMVFIDGSHEYDDVHRDILVWRARLRHGGLLCGHDRAEPGVRRALDELLPGWRSAPGHLCIWWWEEGEMATGLRRMSVEDLRLDGTPNYYPSVAAATPPTPRLTAKLPTEWKQVGGTMEVKKVGLGILLPTITRNGDGTLRYTPPEWGIGLALLAPLANCSHMLLNIKDMDRGPARTALVRQAMSYGARFGMFIDDDVVPPPDTLQKLQYVLENADDDVAVCAGIYTTKSNPAVPLVFQDYGIGPHWRWRRGEVFECQAIATGCMMIDLRKIAALPEPWFVDVHGVEHAKSLGLYRNGAALPLAAEWTDDMYFCYRLREAGLRMMAHGGVICDHWGQDGNCYSLAADSYPMRGSND
jgi:Methyltransferase domain